MVETYSLVRCDECSLVWHEYNKGGNKMKRQRANGKATEVDGDGRGKTWEKSAWWEELRAGRRWGAG